QSVLRQWVDVVHIELPGVEKKVHRLVANEAASLLALEEPPLQRFSLIAGESREILRLLHLLAPIRLYPVFPDVVWRLPRLGRARPIAPRDPATENWSGVAPSVTIPRPAITNGPLPTPPPETEPTITDGGVSNFRRASPERPSLA